MKIHSLTTSALLLPLTLFQATGDEQKNTQENEQKKPSYIDFRWVPVKIESEKPDSEVRNQFDFTLPLHGQYLTNPSSDSVTITWITRVPCGAGIEYREKGSEEFKRVWKKFYGQIDCSSDLHSIHLENLKPGTEYEYRFVTVPNPFMAYDTTTRTGKEIYSFRTLDPGKTTYKVFFVADHHGAARLALDPLVEYSGAEDADFYVFLGDNVEDNMNHARYFMTQGFLDDVSRKWGKSKPTVFLRGNHDISGREQYDFGKYFPRKDGKSYFAFSQGKVLFIVLDSMWSKASPNMPEQTAAYQDYFREQAQWLRDLKKTQAWKDAEFRIVMAHVATHGGSGGTQYMAEFFKDVLNDPSPEGRIHYFLAGHEHSCIRIDPRSADTKVSRPRGVQPFQGDFNYGLLIVNMWDALILNVEPGKLTFTSYDCRKNGEIRDSFIVTTDGAVKDNIEGVKVFPPPTPKAPPARKK